MATKKEREARRKKITDSQKKSRKINNKGLFIQWTLLLSEVDNKVKLRINTNPGLFSPFVDITLDSKANFSKTQDELLKIIRDAQKNNHDKKYLIKLALKGFEAYNNLKNSLRDDYRGDFFLRKIWEKEILSGAEDGCSQIIVNFLVKPGLTFPIGLFYIPEKGLGINNNNIEAYLNELSEKEIIKGFLDYKVSIIKRFNRGDGNLDQTHITSDRRCILRPNETNIELVHAYDDKLKDVGRETSYWNDIDEVNQHLVISKNDLLRKWFMNSNPRIVHFSSHLKFDKAKGYFLTLSNKEEFLYDDIKNSSHKRKIDQKPLVFINACSAGTSHPDMHYNFIDSLYPVYARGFVAPIHGISNSIAIEFSGEFYNEFIKRKKLIINAMWSAKKEFFNRGIFEVLGYSLWETDYTLYFKQNF